MSARISAMTQTRPKRRNLESLSQRLSERLSERLKRWWCKARRHQTNKQHQETQKHLARELSDDFSITASTMTTRRTCLGWCPHSYSKPSVRSSSLRCTRAHGSSLTVWRQVSMHIRYQRQNREPSPFLPTVGLNNLMEQLVLMACRKPTTTY